MHGGNAVLVFPDFPLTPAPVAAVDYPVGRIDGMLPMQGRQASRRACPRPGAPSSSIAYGRPSSVRSKKPMTRRSYSSGWASMPPVWPAPGTFQMALGGNAAS